MRWPTWVSVFTVALGGCQSPLIEVIRAATRNGAVALGLIDDLGTLEVGKRADVVILGADPLADIRNTTQIAAVYQFGRLVGR